MMGYVVDIKQSIEQLHDDEMKQKAESLAQLLIGTSDFQAVADLNWIIRKYEKISRENFGMKRTLSNKDRQYMDRLNDYARG